MVHPQRIQMLGNENPKGMYITYVMHAAVRTVSNDALEHAIGLARSRSIPVVVAFLVFESYPPAGDRHYRFLFEGLADVKDNLGKRGIKFLVFCECHSHRFEELLQDSRLIVTDGGRLARDAEYHAYLLLQCGCHIVDTQAIVPVGSVSDKAEYAARTIRPKIMGKLYDFLDPSKRELLPEQAFSLDYSEHELTGKELLGRYQENSPLMPKGGENAAHRNLNMFFKTGLHTYHLDASDPSKAATSILSPYLHFGNISSRKAAEASLSSSGAGVDAFIEQLVVRRELALNFVTYTSGYDSFECIPEWAKKTLESHAGDTREHIYSLQELERANTHDRYWNAAQLQMEHTGHMHGYMRMYWGKKVLEWSENYADAYKALVTLNDTYEIDGRDPNGYCGIAWCFGLHDRPWKEREIFGKIRYMNENGLKRKFNIDAYAESIEMLEKYK